MENIHLNEQNREALLPKLYRVWKTLNKLAEDRGYTKEENFENLTFEKWIQKNNNKNPLRGIFYKIADNPDIIIRLYYEYLEGLKLNANDIELFLNNMKEGKANSGIIIVSGSLTPKANEKLAEINSVLQVECFNLCELTVNITEHSYVPKHTLLSDEEKSILLKRYKIKESQLPKILSTDPVARYLGLRRGNVVKIIRDSETAGKYVSYRITV